MMVTLLLITGCSQSEYVVSSDDLIVEGSLLEGISKDELSDNEVAGLILMREEEKLARDVYQVLGRTWDIRIFDTIAQSEQTHTTAVKSLLDRYDIADPVVTDSQGIYASGVLQKLYNDLVAKGTTSLLDALIVGATVEDLDIKDLADLLETTDNQDIIATYESLQRGSRNHMRAFVKQIERNGGTYIPHYISKNLYQQIINGSQERGQGGKRK